MKKTYLNPETQVVAMMPQSIICNSGGGGSITAGTSTSTAGSEMGGGTPVGD